MKLDVKINYYDIVNLLDNCNDKQRMDIIKYLILQSESKNFCQKLVKFIERDQEVGEWNSYTSKK